VVASSSRISSFCRSRFFSAGPSATKHGPNNHGQIDLQEPEGLGVDDVEAAASVHENLGEPDVADDGVDNERVFPWARHTVGVVALVEGDGLVGPVQVDWRRHLHRADLSTLLLAVPSRGVRHLPTVDHATFVDLGELLCLVALLLVVVMASTTFRRGPGLMEVAPKHDALLKGVLDGTLMIGARLLEHLVKQVGPSGRLPKVPVLGGSDKICVGSVVFRLRILLAFLLHAALGGRLRDVFLLASLRLLVLPEDGLDRLLTRGEPGGDVHQLARPGGSLVTQFAHQVAASGADEERADDIRVGDVGQLSALLRKPPDVVPQGFPWLLAAASEIPGVPRAHVCALEVSSEGFDQIVPVGNLRRRQMLQPGSGGVREEQGEVVDDEVVGARNRVGNGARRMARLKACGLGGSGEGLRSSPLS
jgi:hypothetical protein